MKRHISLIFFVFFLTSCQHTSTSPNESNEQGIYSDKYIENWSALSVTVTMTFGYHDYQKRMYDSSKNFTDRGWTAFTKAMQTSRIIEGVQVHKQVVTSTITGTPRIAESNTQSFPYTWTVHVPILVTYENEQKTLKSNWNVELHIVQTVQSKNKDGLGIDTWIAKIQDSKDNLH